MIMPVIEEPHTRWNTCRQRAPASTAVNIRGALVGVKSRRRAGLARMRWKPTIPTEEELGAAHLQSGVGVRSEDAAQAVILLDPGHQAPVVIYAKPDFGKFSSGAVRDENYSGV